MAGTMASKETDEFACQRKCLRTPGCSHFSFWVPSTLCHLQDRYALRREGRDGFVSGPFQCWSYLMPGKYTMVHNDTFLPTRFRCMQIGVTWSPDMSTSTYIAGDRDKVVFACQQKCKDTDGCAHFTVMFPGLCRLASNTAVPLPAERTISGPPTEECDDLSSEAPLGHTFMRKFASRPELAPTRSLVHASVAIPAVLVGVAVAALLWQRKRSSNTATLLGMVDLEESLEHEAQE